MELESSEQGKKNLHGFLRIVRQALCVECWCQGTLDSWSWSTGSCQVAVEDAEAELKVGSCRREASTLSH